MYIKKHKQKEYKKISQSTQYKVPILSEKQVTANNRLHIIWSRLQYKYFHNFYGTNVLYCTF